MIFKYSVHTYTNISKNCINSKGRDKKHVEPNFPLIQTHTLSLYEKLRISLNTEHHCMRLHIKIM